MAVTEPLRTTTDTVLSGSLRFGVELVAWVGVPWALWRHSIPLAVAADVVLIGLPTIFGTPGDKSGKPPVAVPGAASIGLELVQVAAAIGGSGVAAPAPAATAVIVLAATATALQVPRWRRLIHL